MVPLDKFELEMGMLQSYLNELLSMVLLIIIIANRGYRVLNVFPPPPPIKKWYVSLNQDTLICLKGILYILMRDKRLHYIV